MNSRGSMNNGVRISHRRSQAIDLVERNRKTLNAELPERFRARSRPDNSRHRVAASDKHTGEMTAEQAGGTGKENAHL